MNDKVYYHITSDEELEVEARKKAAATPAPVYRPRFPESLMQYRSVAMTVHTATAIARPIIAITNTLTRPVIAIASTLACYWPFKPIIKKLKPVVEVMVTIVWMIMVALLMGAVALVYVMIGQGHKLTWSSSGGY